MNTKEVYTVVIDFETGGVNPSTTKPLELAFKLVNKNARSASPVFTLRPRVSYEQAISVCDDFCRDMHTRNGLLEVFHTLPENFILPWEQALDTLDQEVLVLINDRIPVGAELRLGGFSPHFDRKFIEAYFPRVNARLSHRNEDISGACRALGINYWKSTPGGSVHRAASDVECVVGNLVILRKLGNLYNKSRFVRWLVRVFG